MTTPELIYDWNKNLPPGLQPPGPVLINDETLRDGLQSPSVRDPSIAEKIEILHLMEALGIHSLDLGLPGAGTRSVEAVTALARELLGFMWAIAVDTEAQFNLTKAASACEILLDSRADDSRGPTKRRTLDENYAAGSNEPNPRD